MGWSNRLSMSSQPSMSGAFSMSASASTSSTDLGGYKQKSIEERVALAISCTSSESERDALSTRNISSPSYFAIPGVKDDPDAKAKPLVLSDEAPSKKEEASITTNATSCSPPKANDGSFVGTRRRAILTTSTRLSQDTCVANHGLSRPSGNEFESGDVKYDEDAIKKGAFRLRVELANAFGLAKPAYRVGDIASNLVCAGPNAFTGVYVTVGLGKHQKLKTRCAHNPEGKDQVTFPEEKLLFHYHGEAELSVAVYDHRNFQGVFRGDPLIGEGVLPLSVKELCDGRAHSCNLPVSRLLIGPRLPNSGPSVEGGCVVLRYQLVERPDRAVH